jgi:hypothetical protein
MMRIGPELRSREILRQRAFANTNPALVEIGRSLSQACHVAKRGTEANSRFIAAPEGLTLGRF